MSARTRVRPPSRDRPAPTRPAHLRVVEPAAPARRRVPFLVASFLAVSAMVTGTVALQAMASQTSLRIERLAETTRELQQTHGRLKLEVAELRSPARIAREARGMGLRLPDPEHVHTITVRSRPESRTVPAGDDEPSFALKELLGYSP